MNHFKNFITTEKADFFSLSKEEQDVYKMEHEDSLYNPYCSFLHKELFNLDYEKLPEDDNVLSPTQILTLNKHTQYLSGIGKDWFSINESFDTGKSTLSYETLYDYDYEDFFYQENAIAENSKNYTPRKDYEIKMNFMWARGFYKEEFTYYIMSGLKNYIISFIDNVLEDWISSKFPSNVEIVNKQTLPNGMISSTISVNASGNENILNYIKRKAIDYSKNLELNYPIFNEDKIYFLEENNLEKNDPTLYLIFSNENTLKNTRIRTFSEDIEKYKSKDLSKIRKIVFQESEKIKKLLIKDIEEFKEE